MAEAATGQLFRYFVVADGAILARFDSLLKADRVLRDVPEAFVLECRANPGRRVGAV